MQIGKKRRMCLVRKDADILLLSSLHRLQAARRRCPYACRLQHNAKLSDSPHPSETPADYVSMELQ